MRIANAMVFNKISLPPWNKSLHFHKSSRCHNFVFISENTFFLAFPTIGGRLRYFSYWDALLHPQIVIISAFTFSLKFLLKNIEVLSVLIHWPDAYAYFFNKSSSCWEVLRLDFQNMRLLSVNKRWLIIGAPRHTLTPSKNLSRADFLSRLIRPLVHRRKR